MALTKKRTAVNPATLISPNDSAIRASTPSKQREALTLMIESGNKAFIEKNYQEALNHFLDALKLAPGELKVLAKLGQAYYKLRDYPQSIAHFLKALEIDPNDKDNLSNLGMVYAKSGDKAKALSVYDKLKKLNPEKAETLYKTIYA